MMKYFTIILFLFLIMFWNDGRAQQMRQNKDDSLSTVLPGVVEPVPLGAIAKMPTIKFPPEAKILRWYPKNGVHYFMPNALTPAKIVDRIKGLKLKGKKINPDSGNN